MNFSILILIVVPKCIAPGFKVIFNLMFLINKYSGLLVPQFKVYCFELVLWDPSSVRSPVGDLALGVDIEMDITIAHKAGKPDMGSNSRKNGSP